MKSVTIVTATTGRETLDQCVESVQAQTYGNCQHYVVYDGRGTKHTPLPPNVFDITLPKPTGKNGVMNGAILAMATYITTEDYLCFLDDDNWMEPNHIESLVTELEEKKASYAYCLRNLANPDGSFFAQDNGESTGHTGNQFVDANCYLFRRDLTVGIAPLWMQTNGQGMNISDRAVWQLFQQNNIPWAATGKYTLNYRISSRGTDMRPFFFFQNILAQAKNPDGFPWAA